MTIDFEALDTADLSRFAELIHLTDQTGGQTFAILEPARQPTIARKGLFGRTKQVPATWSLRIQHLGRPADTGGYTIYSEHPVGASLADRGVAVPGRATLDFEGDDHAYFLFADDVDADSVAAEALRLARELIGPTTGDDWVIAHTDGTAVADEHPLWY